jgi:acyl carrier protein
MEESRMNRDQVRKTYFDLIKPHVRIEDPSVITESSFLVDDLKVNSTRFVDIILDIEDAFKISISDQEMDKFERVGDAIDFICERTVAA